MLAPRQQQGVDQAVARDRGARRAFKLGIDEGDVERGVVDDQRRVADEGEEVVDDRRDQRLVRQEFGGQPVHRERLLRHLALGIEIAVEGLPGGMWFIISTQPISTSRRRAGDRGRWFRYRG